MYPERFTVTNIKPPGEGTPLWTNIKAVNFATNRVPLMSFDIGCTKNRRNFDVHTMNRIFKWGQLDILLLWTTNGT